MTDRKKTYIITVTILEGRHFIWENMNSAVIVRVDNKKKCTAVKKGTDCPFYNEYMIFELESTYEKLLEKNISIMVIQPKTFCRKRKILGTVKLDVATVMNQKYSQFYHKWAVLSSPKADVVSGATGYLKVDIAVLSRGQAPKIPVNVVNDEIEGNLLTPVGFVSERQRAQFIFDVYKCDNIQSKTAQFIDFGPNKTNNAAMDVRLSTFIEVTFAGLSVRTTLRRNTQSPVFNERLTITDLFPPLCQRIKIEICLEDVKKTVHSVHYLNLKSISNDNIEGFLPTFGPTYIYFYSRQHLEGYAGSLLLSLRTKLLDDTTTMSVGQKANIHYGISSFPEDQHFSFEEIFLFATIFEASCMPKKYQDKLICIRLTFGNITSETEIEGATGDGHPSNVTVAQKPIKSGKNFYYLNYSEEKPCLRIKSKWPDFRKRMFNSNMLEKISNELKMRLDEMEELFGKHCVQTLSLIEEKLKDAIDFVVSAGRKYVDIVSTNYNFDYGTALDEERINMCLKTWNLILDRMEVIKENKSKKYIFRKLEDIQKKLESLVEDAQACWPDVILWITCSNKKVGCARFSARDVVFSSVPEEMGENCGTVRPILFTLFELQAYIFEGEIQPGFDVSGLVDAYVQVSFGKECKETQVKKKVLAPLWDQTLTFHNVYIYGSKEYIKQNPPTVLIQLMDKDQFKTEYIGRNIVIPNITFLDDLPFNHTKEADGERHEKKSPLRFYDLCNQDEIPAELLAGFELIEISQATKVPDEEQIVPIPAQIKPNMVSHRIEVLFWGVRNLKKINLIRINRPRMTFLCADKFIHSDTIENASKNPNFSKCIGTLDVDMASQTEYLEAFIFKLFDSRKFGIYVFAGISLSDITPFMFKPLTIEDRLKYMSEVGHVSDSGLIRAASSEIFLNDLDQSTCTLIKPQQKQKIDKLKKNTGLSQFLKIIKNVFRNSSDKNNKEADNIKSDYSLIFTEDQEDEDDFDWWTKFYASMEKDDKSQMSSRSTKKDTLIIYHSELESQTEFNGFSDLLTTFEIFKGKRSGDEAIDEEHTKALFKGAVKIYQWPPEDGDIDNYVTPHGTLIKDGVLSTYPSNKPINYVLRVYCVRAIGLRPKDLNGKSDPYIQVRLGDKVICDSENYIAKDINPIFGRCFEFQASFPEYTSVIVRVFDHDQASSDDLIGETKIDLENRFYTKHRAYCGIPKSYYLKGYCQWRDREKPSQILNSLCKKCGTERPEYSHTSVNIGLKEFFASDFQPSDDLEYDCEVLALNVLNRWPEMPLVGFKIVPEHVETRSLFTPDKPGIEQGKIQLWIDIFPRQEYPVPNKVDIAPRKPVSYELRVIIWNTEEVVLEEDDFFTGEKKSDIYVKGWLDDQASAQYTDVHYRSLTGEGNFNWRFIFKFDYLSTENRLVYRKKENIFLREESEIKLPCVLNLTVWDNDTFSKDDFLGSLYLELAKMPRGARSAKNCKLSVVDNQTKKINLFKIRRTRGWWPFKGLNKTNKKEMLAGKLEAELELLTKEEAQKTPAGLGRQGPQSLPPPKLPNQELQHHYNNHRYDAHFDEEIPKFFHHPRNFFKDSKCLYCRSEKFKGCKLALVLLILMISAFLVIMGFYFGGYIKKSSPLSCFKRKRESEIDFETIEDDFI